MPFSDPERLKEYRRSSIVKEKQRIYNQTERGRELMLARNKKCYVKHREKRLLYYKEYYDSEEGKIAHKRSRDKLRNDLIILLGARCIICNEDDVRVLEFDHIDGNGNHERKTFGGTRNMITYYRRHIDEAKIKLQLLCCNCHAIKSYYI